MKLKPSTMFAAFALFGIGGFLAGRVSTPPAAVSSAKDSPAETRSSRSSGPSLSVAEKMDGKRLSRDAKADGNRAESAKDRLARLESIMRGENALDRNRALLAFIDGLAPGDFEEAIASFRKMGITDDRMGEYALLLTAWANVDPTAALTYANENTNGGFATDTILTSWAANDPEAAIRWAQANFTGEGANPYLAGIIRGIAETDPTRATQLLTSMPRSEERAKGLDAFLPHLMKQGDEATRAWIDSLADPDLKNGAMMRTARELAKNDPAGTAAWLMAHPGEASQRRVDDVYSVWAGKDQQAALSSYLSLPAGEDRSNALRGLVTNIAVQDPKGAVSMLDRYPADVTDRAVRNVVWHAFGSDPDTAASQIARISDENERNRTYSRAIGMWMQNDAPAAQAWIQKNPLPEVVLKEINNPQKRRQ